MAEEKYFSKNADDSSSSSKTSSDTGGKQRNIGSESAVSSTSSSKKTAESRSERKSSGEQQGNCYCGKDRNLNIVELLCANCSRWYHESCIGYQLGKLVPFLTNYIFFCKNCTSTGLESFKKHQAQYPQLCLSAIANLQHASIKDGTNRTMFSKEKEIIPYIEYHWEALTPQARRFTQMWNSQFTKSIIKEIHVLFVFEDTSDGHMYGLINYDLTQIKPNYEAMIKGGLLKVTDVGITYNSE